MLGSGSLRDGVIWRLSFAESLHLASNGLKRRRCCRCLVVGRTVRSADQEHRALGRSDEGIGGAIELERHAPACRFRFPAPTHTPAVIYKFADRFDESRALFGSELDRCRGNNEEVELTMVPYHLAGVWSAGPGTGTSPNDAQPRLTRSWQCQGCMRIEARRCTRGDW